MQKKFIVFFIIGLFIGASFSIMPIAISENIVLKQVSIHKMNNKSDSSIIQLDVSILLNGWLQWVIENYGPCVNATGITKKPLFEFNGNKTLINFEFVNPEAYVHISWFDVPLWDIFPPLFNFTGPNKYRLWLFYGYVEEISPGEYHIEGHCFRFKQIN
jgi:hypothetical protein